MLLYILVVWVAIEEFDESSEAAFGTCFVGIASRLSETFLGLMPMCSISKRCLNGKQSMAKWSEHNTENSVGPDHALLLNFTKSLHFLRTTGSLGNVCNDTESALVFPQFAATHLIPVPLLLPPRSPRGMFTCALSLQSCSRCDVTRRKRPKLHE